VLDVEPGRIKAPDLLSGLERTMQEVSGARTLVARDVLLARVVTHEGTTVLCGAHPRPRRQILSIGPRGDGGEELGQVRPDDAVEDARPRGPRHIDAGHVASAASQSRTSEEQSPHVGTPSAERHTRNIAQHDVARVARALGLVQLAH
jgi:hypothetical protein